MFTSNDQLASVLADLVNFGFSNFTPDTPDYVLLLVQENIAYQCACFVAQNTKDGDGGVEICEAFEALKVNKDLSKEKRYALALAFVEDFGGVK